MVNSVSNIPPAQSMHNVIAQAQPLQNKEAINEKVAVAQAKNQKKVKEEKDKKNSSKRNKTQDMEESEEKKTEAIDHASVNLSNILIAQETESQKKVISSAKASSAYNYFKNS